jgi:hypothetical protein
VASTPSPEPAGPRDGLIGAAPRDILLFAARTLAWAIVFFGAWYVAAKPISLVTSWIAARALEATTPAGSVRVAWRNDRTLFEIGPDASTTYRDRLPAGMSVDMEVNTLKQTYGVPFFLALLAAARARRFVAKATAGVAILMVLAAIGIACEVAIGFGSTQVAGAQPFAPGAAAGTLFALGLQLGTLIFPCVVPVALAIGFAGRITRIPT